MFVAIESPPDVKAALKRAQEALRAAVDVRAIRWTYSEQFHLTLRFLGNIAATSVESLSVSLSDACRGFSSLRLCARGIGFFPSPRKPRVIWSGVTDSEGRLRELQQLVTTSTAVFSSEEPENDFHGHITLGRIKHLSRRDAAALVDVADRISSTAFGEWTVDNLRLIRSELSSSGPTYTTISTTSLLAQS